MVVISHQQLQIEEAVENARNDGILTFDISPNGLLTSHIVAITAALRDIPLKSAFLRANSINAEACEALCTFLDSQPKLDALALNRTQLWDEGISILAPAIARHPGLRIFQAVDCAITPQGIRDFFGKGGANPRLFRIFLSQYDSEDINTTLAELLLANPSRNLFDAQLLGDEVEDMTSRNRHKITALVQEAPPFHEADCDLTEMTGATLRGLAQRSASVFFLWASNRNELRNQPQPWRETAQMKAEAHFHAFLKTLPLFPENAENNSYSALFNADETGFAPLDNPNLWEGKTLADFAAIPLTRDILSRRTERGSSLLESAFGTFPAGELLDMLHAKGVQLQADALLNHDGQPSPLFDQLIHDNTALPLFTPKNWQNAKVEDMRKVYDALPAQDRSRISYHRLAQEIKPPAAQGIGR